MRLLQTFPKNKKEKDLFALIEKFKFTEEEEKYMGDFSLAWEKTTLFEEI